MTNSAIRRFRKKPVVVEAVQWTGRNLEELKAFTNNQFDTVAPEEAADDPQITAEVWDFLHASWVGVKTGDWVIKGVKGEFYPCDNEGFRETYDEVAPPKPQSTYKAPKQPKVIRGPITLDAMRNNMRDNG